MGRGDSRPACVVVVLHYGDWSTTEACVRSLRGTGYDGAVLLVDNGSDGPPPGWVEAQEGGPAHLLPLPENRGFQGGMNAGARWALAAGAEFVVLVNNDAVFTENCVDGLVRTLTEHPELGGVSPVNHDASGRPVTGRRVPRRLLRIFPAYREDHTMTFACAALTRDCLERAGLLDERFFLYWGDLEYRARLRQHGYAPAADPRYQILHAGGGSRPRDDLLRRGELTAGLALYSRLRGPSWVAGALVQTAAAVGLAVLSTRSVAGARTLLRCFRWGLTIDRPAWQIIDQAPWNQRAAEPLHDRPSPVAGTR